MVYSVSNGQHALTPSPSPTAAGEGSTPSAVPPRLLGGLGGEGVRAHDNVVVNLINHYT